MTDLTHWDLGDMRATLNRADSGDKNAKRIVASEAREWLWYLLGTIASDRAELQRRESALRAADRPETPPSVEKVVDDPQFLKAFHAGDAMADAIITLRNAAFSLGAACVHDQKMLSAKYHAATNTVWRLCEERLAVARGEAGDLLARASGSGGRRLASGPEEKRKRWHDEVTEGLDGD